LKQDQCDSAKVVLTVDGDNVGENISVHCTPVNEEQVAFGVVAFEVAGSIFQGL
jgi:hypothetical protein